LNNETKNRVGRVRGHCWTNCTGANRRCNQDRIIRGHSAGQNNSNAPAAGETALPKATPRAASNVQAMRTVSALEKNANGVWGAAKGSKGGTTSNVSVDFEGKVNPTK
jgi:hypothetical protein